MGITVILIQSQKYKSLTLQIDSKVSRTTMGGVFSESFSSCCFLNAGNDTTEGQSLLQPGLAGSWVFPEDAWDKASLTPISKPTEDSMVTNRCSTPRNSIGGPPLAGLGKAKANMSPENRRRLASEPDCPEGSSYDLLGATGMVMVPLGLLLGGFAVRCLSLSLGNRKRRRESDLSLGLGDADELAMV